MVVVSSYTVYVHVFKWQVNGFNCWQVSSTCSALNRRELTSRLSFAAAVKHFKPQRSVVHIHFFIHNVVFLRKLFGYETWKFFRLGKTRNGALVP